MTALHWMDFECSDDGEGTGTFDALASVRPADRDALSADIARVLDWAHRFGGPRGPVGEGGEWDYELQRVESAATDATPHFDAAAHRVVWSGDEGGSTRVTVALTLSGTTAFCDAFRAAFGLDEPPGA